MNNLRFTFLLVLQVKRAYLQICTVNKLKGSYMIIQQPWRLQTLLRLFFGLLFLLVVVFVAAGVIQTDGGLDWKCAQQHL